MYKFNTSPNFDFIPSKSLKSIQIRKKRSKRKESNNKIE